MTQDSGPVVNATPLPNGQHARTQQPLLRRLAALLKGLFAGPGPSPPGNERGKTREAQGGVFQPPRY